MAMDWIRKTYKVPAKRGGRVEYDGGRCPQIGTITGSLGGYLRVRLDGCNFSLSFHPTWKLRYLDAAPLPPERS